MISTMLTLYHNHKLDEVDKDKKNMFLDFPIHVSEIIHITRYSETKLATSYASRSAKLYSGKAVL